jgi:Putative MetA-pathway of phenol degradation
MDMKRWMKWYGVIGIILVGGLIGLQPSKTLAAEKERNGPEPRPSTEKNWQIGFTPSYSSGNFGTSTTSNFLYAPWSLRRLFRNGDITIVLPFVSASTDGRATLVGGNPTQVDGESNSGSGGGGGSGSSGAECGDIEEGEPLCGTTTRSAGQSVRTAGLGDVALRGRYYAVEERGYVPLIAVTGRMKFPTANEKLGLGTGRFDHGYGVEISKMLGSNWIAFLDGGYNFLGNPAGLVLRDQYWYDVGAGYYLTKNLLTSVYFEEYRAPRAGRVNIRDFFFAFNYKLSDEWRFNGGMAVGVSNGAPDYVLSFGTSYRF